MSRTVQSSVPSLPLLFTPISSALSNDEQAGAQPSQNQHQYDSCYAKDAIDNANPCPLQIVDAIQKVNAIGVEPPLRQRQAVPVERDADSRTRRQFS